MSADDAGTSNALSPAKVRKQLGDLLKDNEDASRLTAQLNPLLVALHEIHSQDRETLLDAAIPVVKGKALVSLLKLLRRADVHKPTGDGLYLLCQHSLLHLYGSSSYIYGIILNLILGRSLNVPLFELVSSCQSIMEAFLCEAVTCIRLRTSRDLSVANHILDLFSHVFRHNSSLLDTPTVDFLVQSIHNYIINAECTNMPILRKTLKLYIEIESLCYGNDDLVTSANIDKILQFQILLGNFTVEEYAPAFKGKDATWIENSLLSLECLAYSDLADISYLTSSQKVQWKSVMDYLDLFVRISQYSNGKNIKTTLLRPLFSLLLKLCRIIDIPLEYSSRFKINVSKILYFAYRNDRRPYENLKFFLLLLTYATFSTDSEVRRNAHLALNAMLSLDVNIVAPYFDATDPGEFNRICIDCILGYANEKSHVYIMKNLFERTQSEFSDFNFDELFYTALQLPDLNIVRTYSLALEKYPKVLKKKCQDQLESWSFSSDLDSQTLNLMKLIINRKTSIPDFGLFRANTIPLYPGSTKKETRIYLFVLSLLTEKKKLDMHDFMICDMFRFNDPDIVSYLVSILDRMKLIDIILVRFIEILGDQNLILLSVVEFSPNLFQAIYDSDSRFHIMKACMIGDPLCFGTFLSFFGKLVNSSPSIQDPRPLFNLLKTIERTYLDWPSEDRVLFWEELTKYSTHPFLQKSFVVTLNDFLKNLEKDERRIIVNQQIAIPLIINEIEKMTTEDLKKLVTEKVASYRPSLRPHSKSKKPQKSTKPNKVPERKIIKLHDLPLDKSMEELHVSITVYPDGRYNDETPNDKTTRKKLSKKDRKFLFLRNLSADKSSKIIVQGKPTVITRYCTHFIKTVINDLFKGLFQGNVNIGNFIGHLFNTKNNFVFASDEAINEILKDFKLNCGELTKYLFAKLSFYLESRNLMDAGLSRKLKILNSEGGELSEFIKEEFDVCRKS